MGTRSVPVPSVPSAVRQASTRLSGRAPGCGRCRLRPSARRASGRSHRPGFRGRRPSRYGAAGGPAAVIAASRDRSPARSDFEFHQWHVERLDGRRRGRSRQPIRSRIAPRSTGCFLDRSFLRPARSPPIRLGEVFRPHRGPDFFNGIHSRRGPSSKSLYRDGSGSSRWDAPTRLRRRPRRRSWSRRWFRRYCRRRWA